MGDGGPAGGEGGAARRGGRSAQARARARRRQRAGAGGAGPRAVRSQALRRRRSSRCASCWRRSRRTSTRGWRWCARWSRPTKRPQAAAALAPAVKEPPPQTPLGARCSIGRGACCCARSKPDREQALAALQGGDRRRSEAASRPTSPSRARSRRSGRPTSAVAALQAAQAQAADDPELMVELGEAYLGLGRPVDAEARFRAALDKKPDARDARIDLGRGARGAEQARRSARAVRSGGQARTAGIRASSSGRRGSPCVRGARTTRPGCSTRRSSRACRPQALRLAAGALFLDPTIARRDDARKLAEAVIARGRALGAGAPAARAHAARERTSRGGAARGAARGDAGRSARGAPGRSAKVLESLEQARSGDRRVQPGAPPSDPSRARRSSAARASWCAWARPRTRWPSWRRWRTDPKLRAQALLLDRRLLRRSAASRSRAPRLRGRGAGGARRRATRPSSSAAPSTTPAAAATASSSSSRRSSSAATRRRTRPRPTSLLGDALSRGARERRGRQSLQALPRAGAGRRAGARRGAEAHLDPRGRLSGLQARYPPPARKRRAWRARARASSRTPACSRRWARAAGGARQDGARRAQGHQGRRRDHPPARARPIRCARAVVDGDVRLNYGELEERVNRLTHGLRALGIGPGERIAAFLHNGHEYLELTAALNAVGGVSVQIGYRLKAGEVAYILENSGARALLFHGDLAPVVEEALALAAAASAARSARPVHRRRRRAGLSQLRGPARRRRCDDAGAGRTAAATAAS